MEINLLNYLRCNYCYSEELNLKINKQYNNEVEEGKLLCKGCNNKFDIKEGILDLLKDDDKVNKNEINTRDKQVNIYHLNPSIFLLNLFERPLIIKAASLNDAKLILELGCGTGRITEKLLDCNYELICIDFSFNSLLYCKKKVNSTNKINFIRSDISNLPFKDDLFGKIICAQAIHHLPNMNLIDNALKEIHRVSKNNSIFIVSIYYYSLLMKVFSNKKGLHRGGIWYYRFTEQELKEKLSQYFKNITIKKLFAYSLLAICKNE